MSIVVAILIFGMIIFIHELGHFIVAKACGVKVNEFALGMGPKLFGFKKGETTYALRARTLTAVTQEPSEIKKYGREF